MLSEKWLVCIGCFLIQFTVFGFHNNYGMIYNELIERYHHSPPETAFIGSLSLSMTLLVGPLSHILTNQFGFIIMMLCAIFISIAGLIAASFVVANSTLLAISFSVFVGSGMGFANHASLVVLQANFDKQLSLANGIASSGTGVGTFVIGPVITLILANYNMEWLLRTLCVLPLLFLFSIVFHRTNKPSPEVALVETPSDGKNEQLAVASIDTHDTEITTSEGNDMSKDTEENNNELLLTERSTRSTDRDIKCIASKKSVVSEIFDKELWTHKPYIALVAGVFLVFFGYPTPFIFLVRHVTTLGISKSAGQFLMGMLAIFSVCCKILSGILLNYQKTFERIDIFLFAMYTVTLSQLIVIFGSEYWHFCIYSMLYGIAEGCLIGQLAAVIVDNVPSKKMIGQGIGNVFAMMAIPVMLGPLLGGQISSSINSTTAPFKLASGFCFTGAIVTTTVKFLNKKVIPVKVDYDVGGVTKIHLLEPSLLCSCESLVITNKCSATFSGLTRSETYRKTNKVNTQQR